MYYVTMTDSFMSGWGRAEGRINKFVVACDSFSQAEIIAMKARQRSEMKYVRISTRKPCYDSTRYLTSWRKYDEIHWK